MSRHLDVSAGGQIEGYFVLSFRILFDTVQRILSRSLRFDQEFNYVRPLAGCIGMNDDSSSKKQGAFF